MKLPTRKQFQAYERVRRSGRYNMFDPRARRETGLSGETYSAIVKCYRQLIEKYPDVRKVHT